MLSAQLMCSDAQECSRNDLDHELIFAARSGYRPSQSVVIKACQRVQNNIETIQMKGIGQFLYVVGRSGYKPSDLLKNTVGRVLRMARRMQPASLSATIRGFSICQYLSEPVIQAVRDAAFAKLWEFLPDDLAGEVSRLVAAVSALHWGWGYVIVLAVPSWPCQCYETGYLT